MSAISCHRISDCFDFFPFNILISDPPKLFTELQPNSESPAGLSSVFCEHLRIQVRVLIHLDPSDEQQSKFAATVASSKHLKKVRAETNELGNKAVFQSMLALHGYASRQLRLA